MSKYLPTKAALAKKQNSETDLDERISLPTRRRRGERKTTDDAQKRREKKRERVKGEREFVLLVILTIVFFSLLCWCGVANACVLRACVKMRKKRAESHKKI